MALDLTYLKKRAEMTRDMADEKVRAALLKIVAPKIELGYPGAPDGIYFTASKFMRNWIDLIPDDRRGFVSIKYEDGGCDNIEESMRAATAAPMWKSFRSFVSKDQSDSDMEPMRILIWKYLVIKEPLGFDFGNYEMNNIFNALPIDIAAKKIKIETPDPFVFYKMMKNAIWAVENAG